MELKRCLFCDTDLDASVSSEDYQFCDACVHKLELLDVNLNSAEEILREEG